MRVRANHGRVHERRAATLAAPPDGIRHRAVAVRATSVPSQRTTCRFGERLDETRDAAAGRLRLDRNGDGVAVVFDEKDHGQLAADTRR